MATDKDFKVKNGIQAANSVTVGDGQSFAFLNGRTSADFGHAVQAIDDQGEIYGSSTFDPTDLIL